MFCMARIVCHLKFEAIALSPRFAYPAPIQGGSLRQNSPKITIQKMPRTFVRSTELS